MKKCPFCAELIQEDAVKCRYCGEFLDGRPRVFPLGYGGFTWGYEYRSPQKVWGVPLVHVAFGLNPETGLPRVAKGIIAVGNFAVGVLAVGGFAAGGLVFSGIGLGIIALGGIAAGAIAAGGVALGSIFAVGGVAISGSWAIGSVAIAPKATGLTTLDWLH